MSEQLNLFGEVVGLKELKRTKSEVFNDYNSFVDKFEAKKTTDDCYTPPAVYDAVLEFVKSIYPMDGVQVVRPFMPGGDYENFEYPERCAVVDNPPFSILSKIIRFYCAHDIPFFMFAPALTLFSAPDCDVTYIVCGASVVYENKAEVCTSFITNMVKDARIWVCPQLSEAIEEAQKMAKTRKKVVVYPSHIVTSATLQRLVRRGVEFVIPKESCFHIKDTEIGRRQGIGLFGGGFLLSDAMAAMREKVDIGLRSESDDAVKLPLSTKELRMIGKLNENEKLTRGGYLRGRKRERTLNQL